MTFFFEKKSWMHLKHGMSERLVRLSEENKVSDLTLHSHRRSLHNGAVGAAAVIVSTFHAEVPPLRGAL